MEGVENIDCKFLDGDPIFINVGEIVFQNVSAKYPTQEIDCTVRMSFEIK